MPTLIDTDRIRTDLGTQIRVETNDSIIKEYAEDMQRGDKFPPIAVMYDDENDYFILVDGFHRLSAHKIVFTNDQIFAEVKRGNLEDAKSESAAANKTNSFRRTNADKRNAVETILPLENWKEKSDREIARHVGVSNDFASRIRNNMVAEGRLSFNDSRTGADGRTINTAKIGKHRPTSIKRTGSGFVVVKSPTPLGATCAACRYWDKNNSSQEGYCYCDCNDEETANWHSCEEWAPTEDDEPPSQEVVPTVNEDIDKAEIWTPPKQRGKKLFQYEKTRNSISVNLPCKNAELFAVELRNHFDEEYLYAVWAAYKKIAADNE